MKTAIRLGATLIVIFAAWPAAALPRALVCQAVGTLQGHDEYLDAAGTCNGGLDGPFTVTIYTPFGAGGVDPCITSAPPDAIPVTVTLTNVRTGQSTTQVQEWTLVPVTAGVPLIAFTIRKPSAPIQKTLGVGVIVTRVFGALTCNGIDEDRPSATFEWAVVG